MSNIFWCDNCNVPLLSSECSVCHCDVRRIASDVRPIFPEEKRLLEILLQYPVGYLRKTSVWGTNSNNIIIDGETVMVNKGKLLKLSPAEIREELKKTNTSGTEINDFFASMQLFVNHNKDRINVIDINAFDIISQAKTGCKRHIPIVSFSGGKDSTVVSDLVRRAYANQSIIHIFGNTTLELPETMCYLERFKEFHNKTPFLESKSQHSFFDLCDRIGPPSRVMRWCCTVFKTGPIGQTFDGLRNKMPHLLTFYGIRRSESNQRAGYKAITSSPKVSQQTVVSPIIDWLDADIWLYIFSRQLDFNDAYRKGFTRVGCWSCPSNSLWSFFLTRIYHPELSEPWRNYLIEVAKSMGKPDPVEYVDSGNWKARQGGQGLKTAYKGVVISRPCGDDPNAKTYTLARNITEDLYEYFKPFGQVMFGMGRSLLGEVFVVEKDSKEPVLILQGRTGTTDLRVKVVNSNNPTLLLQRVDCQIRKYQSCILCGGCLSACPVGAVSYKSGKYEINENKCINCHKCISHFDTGCLVSKVLQTKRG